MQLKQLNAFCAVVDTANFSVAARQTGLSQPTLSRLVKQLENELGVELIDRYHRPLQLTPAGEFFYQRIEQVLIDLNTTVVLTKKIATPTTELNIGFVPSVLYGMLPVLIGKLRQRHPDFHISLKDISTFKQVNALKLGEIDFGFGRFVVNDSKILQILLRHERFVVALPKSHHLAHQHNLALNELINDTLILYHQTHLPAVPDHHESEPLKHIFEKHHALPVDTLTVSDIQVALGLVAANVGITLVPASLQSLRQDDIAYCTLRHEDVTSPIYLSMLESPTPSTLPTLLEVIYSVYENRGFTYTPYHLQ